MLRIFYFVACLSLLPNFGFGGECAPILTTDRGFLHPDTTVHLALNPLLELTYYDRSQTPQFNSRLPYGSLVVPRSKWEAERVYWKGRSYLLIDVGFHALIPEQRKIEEMIGQHLSDPLRRVSISFEGDAAASLLTRQFLRWTVSRRVLTEYNARKVAGPSENDSYILGMIDHMFGNNSILALIAEPTGPISESLSEEEVEARLVFASQISHPDYLPHFGSIGKFPTGEKIWLPFQVLADRDGVKGFNEQTGNLKVAEVGRFSKIGPLPPPLVAFMRHRSLLTGVTSGANRIVIENDESTRRLFLHTRAFVDFMKIYSNRKYRAISPNEGVYEPVQDYLLMADPESPGFKDYMKSLENQFAGLRIEKANYPLWNFSKRTQVDGF